MMYIMMPAIQAHLAPVKNPAPSARPRIPNMMTMIARARGPEAIPARTDAPPKRERVNLRGSDNHYYRDAHWSLRFQCRGLHQLPISRFYMISLLDIPMARVATKTTRSLRAPVFARNCLFATFSRGFSGVVESGCLGLEMY